MPLYRKGTDTAVIGTVEVIAGTALASGILADGSPAYDGETKVWWDEQRTIERNGETVWIDADGEELLQSEVEQRDD